MSDITMLRVSVDSKRKMHCFKCEVGLGEGVQYISIQTPIAVKVFYPSKHPAFRKSLGSNLEARCERCGKINLYDLNYWEEYGEAVQD